MWRLHLPREVAGRDLRAARCWAARRSRAAFVAPDRPSFFNISLKNGLFSFIIIFTSILRPNFQLSRKRGRDNVALFVHRVERVFVCLGICEKFSLFVFATMIRFRGVPSAETSKSLQKAGVAFGHCLLHRLWFFDGHDSTLFTFGLDKYYKAFLLRKQVIHNRFDVAPVGLALELLHKRARKLAGVGLARDAELCHLLLRYLLYLLAAHLYGEEEL